MPDFEPAAPNLRSSNSRADMVTGSTSDFVVQFWGVRGQISTPGKETMRYGGNTSCVEMRVGKKRLIFDCGSGLRVLGNNLLSQMPVEAYIFLTNCHWDSIQGFPFFVPGFIPGNCFIFMEQRHPMVHQWSSASVAKCFIPISQYLFNSCGRS
jgi:phosphoribosyl 1,2-cyclic phosphodiesterase